MRQPVRLQAAEALTRFMPSLSSIPIVRQHISALNGKGMPGHIALTFNTGPDPVSTPAFLDLLAEHQVRATFFVIGSMLHRAPSLGRAIVGAGHEIGILGWHHRYLLTLRTEAITQNLAATCDLVTQTTGAVPARFRPPNGLLTARAARSAHRLKLEPVLWTASGHEGRLRATAESVTSAVTRELRPGGVVLLHDSDCTSVRGSWRATLQALPSLLSRWRENGWQSGPLNEHYGAVGDAGRNASPSVSD